MPWSIKHYNTSCDCEWLSASEVSQTQLLKSVNKVIWHYYFKRNDIYDKLIYIRDKTSFMTHTKAAWEESGIWDVCGFVCNTYPSLCLKCLKARLRTSCTNASGTGWRGIWAGQKKTNKQKTVSSPSITETMLSWGWIKVHLKKTP